MLRFTRRAGGNVLKVDVGGELTHADHVEFLRHLEGVAREYGKARLLCVLKGFKGAEASSGWEDPTFGLRDKALVKRLALVGGKKHRRWLRPLAEPFTEVRFFTPKQQKEAERWVAEGAEEEAERERLSRLAYARWEAAGRPEGDGARFWLEAEREHHQVG